MIDTNKRFILCFKSISAASKSQKGTSEHKEQRDLVTYDEEDIF